MVADRSNAALTSLLRRTASDEKALALSASRSHRHQLGFLKIVLYVGDDGESLRLHVWDRASILPEDPHSHCADFTSRVVSGSFIENKLALTDGDSHAMFSYRFDAEAGHAVAEALGSAGVRTEASRTLRAGNIYIKHANELHNVTNAAGGTITVSAWQPRTCNALVLKPAGTSAQDCEATLGMAPEELAAVFGQILERLSEE